MKILYIERPIKRGSLLRRFNLSVRKLSDGQHGFFDAALSGAGTVETAHASEVMSAGSQRLRSYDAVVVSSKCTKDFPDESGDLFAALKAVSIPKAIFMTQAHPDQMYPDTIFDVFDVIFKREPYADLERYNLALRNRDKIVPTHLANPFARLSTHRFANNREGALRKYAWQSRKRFDVGFLGSVGGMKFDRRHDVWKRIVSEDFVAFGGLTPKPGTSVAPHLTGTKVGKPEYMSRVYETAVNLALSGHGPFTFRHLELLWAGAFMLSEREIVEQRLRAPLVEDRDFVAFDTLDEMVDKIRYYLDRPADRLRIAQNGRAAYERLHNVPAHAKEIYAALAQGPKAARDLIEGW